MDALFVAAWEMLGRDDSRAWWLMSPMNKEAPLDARTRAVASPIPEAPPVSTKAFPANEAMLKLLNLGLVLSNLQYRSLEGFEGSVQLKSRLRAFRYEAGGCANSVPLNSLNEERGNHDGFAHIITG